MNAVLESILVWMFRPAAWAALLLAATLPAGCAPPLAPYAGPEVRARPPEPAVELWQMLEPEEVWTSPGWFWPVNSSEAAFQTQLAMADTATETIDLVYYLWYLDKSGSLVLDRLLEAADRGVRVRILIDDVTTAGRKEALLWAAAHPNVQVRAFNPFVIRPRDITLRTVVNLNHWDRLTHRLHNKALIADGRLALVGGRNIGDEYFGYSGKVNFRDFGLVVYGRTVGRIAAVFDTYWNSGWAFPTERLTDASLDADRLAQLRQRLRKNYAQADWPADVDITSRDWSSMWQTLGDKLVPGEAHIFADDPDVRRRPGPYEVAEQLIQVLQSAKREVIIVSPYMIPTDFFRGLLDLWRQHGVRVVILTNSLAATDTPVVHPWYARARDALLDAGVELYESRQDPANRYIHEAEGFQARRLTLHAKVVVIDRRIVFTGSPNFDPRSFFLNLELGMLVYSRHLAEGVLHGLEPDFGGASSWRVVHGPGGRLHWVGEDRILYRQPTGGWWRYLTNWVWGLPPIRGQL